VGGRSGGESNEGLRLLHRFNPPLPVGSGAAECLDSHRHIAGLGREDVEIFGRALGESVRRERETAGQQEGARLRHGEEDARHLDLKVGDRTAAHRDPLERARSTSGCHACLIAAGR